MKLVLKDRRYHKRDVFRIEWNKTMDLPHGAGCELVLVEGAGILDVDKGAVDVESGLNAGRNRAAMEVLQDTGC